MLAKENLFASLVCTLLFVVLRVNANSICEWEENAFRLSGTYPIIRLAVPEDVEEVEGSLFVDSYEQPQSSIRVRLQKINDDYIEDYNGPFGLSSRHQPVKHNPEGRNAIEVI
nr:unnamed protein product [Spirometra erinaceieuropaei]